MAFARGRAPCASSRNKNLQPIAKSGNMVPTSRNKKKDYQRERVPMDNDNRRMRATSNTAPLSSQTRRIKFSRHMLIAARALV
jgi:hypothetical protein